MRVGIVGAGLSGLAAGRRIVQAGHDVVVFEKSSAVGGRVATRRVGQYTFDTGATSFAPRGLNLEHAMLSELETQDLVRVEKPIYTHSALRIFPGDSAKAKVPRYTYLGGNNRLAKLLAETLDVRLETPVQEIGRHGSGFAIAGEAFDALILTPPIPQTQSLLWSLQDSRPFGNSNYRSCLSVLLGYSRQLEPQRFHALLDPEQKHPLTWLSIETEKCPGRAPAGHTAMVAQLNGPYSATHFEDDEAPILDLVLDTVARLFGPSWNQPIVTDIKRWKYSQPEGIASFEAANRQGTKVIIASDGLLGGRAEQAFECGVRAASLLLG
jgi:renalase